MLACLALGGKMKPLLNRMCWIAPASIFTLWNVNTVVSSWLSVAPESQCSAPPHFLLLPLQGTGSMLLYVPQLSSGSYSSVSKVRWRARAGLRKVWDGACLPGFKDTEDPVPVQRLPCFFPLMSGLLLNPWIPPAEGRSISLGNASTKNASKTSSFKGHMMRLTLEWNATAPLGL